MIDTIFHLAKSSNPWRFLGSYIERLAITLLSEPAPPSMNRATLLLSAYVPLRCWDEEMVATWASVVSAVPYSEKLGWSVVDTLLVLANEETLRPYIPIDIWALLKEQPSLPPVCPGRDLRNNRVLVHHVRELRDIDLLKSYFLLVWSEWNVFDNSDSEFAEIRVSIMEDFGGIEMLHHRAGLIERLDRVRGELDQGLEHLKKYKPEFTEGFVLRGKARYGTLRAALLEVEQKAMGNLVGMSEVSRFQQAC